MARKFQNIAFGYAIPSYFHNIESTLHISVHVYYITVDEEEDFFCHISDYMAATGHDVYDISEESTNK